MIRLRYKSLYTVLRTSSLYKLCASSLYKLNIVLLLTEKTMQAASVYSSKFLVELKEAQQQLSEDSAELKKKLEQMRKELMKKDIIQADIVYNLILAYRDIQDYDVIISFVEDFHARPNRKASTDTIGIQHMYALALNRRKKVGDRNKALAVIKRVATEMEGGDTAQEVACLLGRIYKDMFYESQCRDTESRNEAVKWYRKGFEIEANVFAGVNLTTMLAISGKDFKTDKELQRIVSHLYKLIEQKGALSQLQDYWDVATYFEISVLSKNYSRASKAAECMFKLHPLAWQLNSTLDNLKLISAVQHEDNRTEMGINQSKWGSTNRNGDQLAEIQKFSFWIEFLTEAARGKDENNKMRFLVLILDNNNVCTPGYVTISQDSKSQVAKQFLGEQSSKPVNEWCVERKDITSVSQFKSDSRALFLCTRQKRKEHFNVFFPSEFAKKRFYDALLNTDMIASKE